MSTLFEIIDSQELFEDEIIERLKNALENGADINAKDGQGWTVLHRAVSKNQGNIVKFLVQKGADINVENESGVSVPLLATRNRSWSILKWLVEERGVKIPMANEQNRKQVEATLRIVRNTRLFSVLNDQTDAVLIIGQSDSAVRVLTEFLAKYDGKTCNCLMGNEDTSNTDSTSPILIVEGESDVVYYGSVIGNENPPDDIASSFFLKKMIDYVEYVKIVFSINYPTVKNLNDFMEFVSSAANFFGDLNKFSRSIGLIVTKFEDDDGTDENTILYEVANSLKELKQRSENESTQLLDVFLRHFDQPDDYANLGVFRVNKSPDKVLSEYHGSTSVPVVKNLWYTLKDEKDFRYSISEESKELVYDLIERINIGVTFDVIDVANDLQKFYDAEISQAKNLHKLQEKLNSQSSALAAMAFEILSNLNPLELMDVIVKHIDKMDISVSGTSLKSIKQWGYCMDFLHIAAGRIYQATTWNWVDSITEVSRSLADTNKWYEFLLDLYGKFSTYEIQKDKTKYDVANLSDWGKENAGRGIAIDRNNWKQFLSITQRYLVRQYDHVKDMPPDRLKLKDLNHILDLSFKRNAEVSCESLRRIVKGNFVFLSDLLKNNCYKNAYYEVFALNTVFIDTNLNQCNLKGVIIAPKWEIIGQKVLGLTTEGQFIGIGREFTGMGNFNFYFTKGKRNLERMNMIENGTTISPNVTTSQQHFQKSLACVEKQRLSHLDQISYNIDDYKSYLRENLNDNVQQQVLIDFVRNFEQSDPILDLYDSLGFVRELQEMEGHFYNLNGQIDFLPFYQSLLARLTNYIDELKPEDKTSQRKIVLTYAFATVQSKINTLKYGTNTNLVIDIKEYLDLLSSNIKELGEIEKQALDTSKKFGEINKRAKLEEHRKNYASEIYKKIEEANYFIDNYILPEINNISDQLIQEMEELIREIDEIKHQVEQRKQQLIKYKKQIERQIALRTVLGFLRIFGSILSIFGPIGAIAGAVINTAVGIGETFIPDSSKELAKLEQITLPEGLDVERNLRKRDVGGAIASTGDSVTSLLNNAKSDKEKLQIVKDAIKQADEQIHQLEEFKTYVRSKVTPWLKGVLGNFQAQAKNLQGKSHVALDVGRWQIQNKLKDLKFHLVDATKGFKVQRHFQRSVEKIGDALNTLVNIFDRIQNYEDQKRLADYIADISLVQYDAHDLQDLSFMNITSNLERIITSNILLSYYDSAVSNFKQFTFPFADYYLKDFTISSVLTDDGKVQTLVDNAVRRISTMKSVLTQSSTTINSYFDSNLHKTHFTAENEVVGPFYVWHHSEYRESMVNLLKGEEIALNADIMQSESDRNAVKFDTIDLQLKAVNASKQPELEAKLKYFEISMTHRGNSYYRCGSKFYIINTDSLTITHSFQKGTDGKPISTNLVYEKLRRGDLLLSPYAMWTVKLTPTTIAFKELKKYAHEIDLVLVGHGQYLSRNSDVCDHDLNKYYQVDETLSDVNFIDAQYTAQALRSIDDQYMCISGASSLSSPLNKLIKWLTSDWSQTTWFSESASGNFKINPVEFYNRLDSGLVLAPVLLHLWNKFFNRKPERIAKKVDVSTPKIEEWEQILSLCEELVGLLEGSLGPNHSGVMWYADVLLTRIETVQKIRAKQEVDVEAFDELQKNLFAFYEDLNEDLKYDPMFIKAKDDDVVRVAVRRLGDAFRTSSVKVESVVEKPRCDELVMSMEPIYLQAVNNRDNNGPMEFCKIGRSQEYIRPDRIF